MVCESCEKQLSKLAVPDKWKADGSSESSNKIGKTNKVLSKLSRNSSSLSDKDCKCRICKNKIQHGMNYCNDCAHKKGLCTRCGKKVIDTSKHKMSLV